MGASAPLPLPTGSYSTPDPRSQCRRLVNCFVQGAPQTPQLGPNPLDSKQKAPPVSLRRAAGISVFADTGTDDPVRGMWLMQGILYAVIGSGLYTVTRYGALAQIGTNIAGTGLVRMSDNTYCLVILVPGSAYAYTYTATNGFGTVELTAAAADLGYIDSYIVFVQANGRGFFGSDSQEVSGTGPISFTTGIQFFREFATDLFIGMSIDHRYITMYGTNTTEGYIDVGNSVGSPFASAPDNFVEIGAIGAYCIAKQDQSVFWLATDRTVRRKMGQTPLRVSNHAIEDIIAKADLSGAYALTYAYSGHLFYALTVPSIQRTLAYDITTEEWAELESYGLGYWRPLCAVQAYGLQLVGDSQSGKIGFLDVETFTEFGTVQPVTWIHQPVYSGHDRVSHKRVELFMGAGLEVQYGVTPLVSLHVSDDGGKTFRAFPIKSLGQTGEYKNRVIWTNCGTSRERVYKFSVSDPILTWVPDVRIEIAPGISG